MDELHAHWAIAVAACLFCVGLLGVLFRRNLVFVLLSLEIMINATALAFIAAGMRWAQADGQIVFLFILTVAGAEVAVGLAIVLGLYGKHRTLSSDAMKELRG